MSYNELLGKRPGRNKIIYNPEELERTPLITVVVGMQGVGKTWQTLIDIDNYTKGNPLNGRRAGKALILDFSLDESYQKYKAVLAENVRQLSEPRARRIVPYDVRGNKFDTKKMRDTAGYVTNNYMNGLVVMDDLDKYMTGAKGQSLIGAMTTVRHQGLDLILTHQSLAKVSKTEWENAAFIRFHHQLDNVDLIRSDISYYPLMKIAQIIVDKRYFQAVEDYKVNSIISEEEYKKRRSFFVYINTREHNIIGCNIQEFQDAVMQFIRINPRMISERMKVGDELGRSLDKQGAMRSLYRDYANFFQK